MKKYSRVSSVAIIVVTLLVSCNQANVVQTPLIEEKQSTPAIFPSVTRTPVTTSTLTATPYPVSPEYATSQALGTVCINAKEIHTLEISPNGQWLAATCYWENVTEASPLQVSSIGRSQEWKIYQSNYVFSIYLDKIGFAPDRHDEVRPYHWSKDGRFLFAAVRSRLEGCCWIGGRYVLLVRLNLETGEQIALLNTDYYSSTPFDFNISDDDRYLLFSPPSDQSYDLAVLDFETWETQQVFLKLKGDIDVAHARISSDASKVVLPLFKQLEFNNFYVNSIALIDLITGEQNILISDITPENELFPVRWVDNSHVLLSNINPVYDVSNEEESHWLLDIYSKQLEEESP